MTPNACVPQSFPRTARLRIGTSRAPTHLLMCAAAVLPGLLLCSVPSAHAQTVVGRVEDAGHIPVPGVVVELVDTAALVRAFTISGNDGAFRVASPLPGRYRIRTLRIGYRPGETDLFTIAAGEQVERRIELAGVRTMLDTVRVVARNVCRLAGDSTTAAYRIWEQVRGALTATRATAELPQYAATRMRYERTLDRGGSVVDEHSSFHLDDVAAPWVAAGPAVLHDSGYIAEAGDSTVYRIPGLDMLASQTFIDDHCFRLVSTRDVTLIGVAFEPTRERRNQADVAGTVWVDRASSELRRMEFHYANPRDPMLEVRAGGTVQFARLANGSWVVSRWDLQMPVIGRRLMYTGYNTLAPGRTAIGQRQVGGLVALMQDGRDTLWAAPVMEAVGIVLDSATGRPVPGARLAVMDTPLHGQADADGRFGIAGFVPGRYTIDIRTPALDSLNTLHRSAIDVQPDARPITLRVPNAAQVVAAICGNVRTAGTTYEMEGIVVGDVRPAPSPADAAAAIVVEWTDVEAAERRRLTLNADSTGHFRVCSAPLNTPLLVHAERDDSMSAAYPLQVTESRRIARLTLPVDRAMRAVATFAGTVADAAGRPVAGAEVMVAAASGSGYSDGRGAFTVPDVPTGQHRVVVRKIGFGPLDTVLTFGRDSIERHIVLTAVTTLAEVRVAAEAVDRRMRDFEENRRLGLGHFLTRDDLERAGSTHLDNVMLSFPGALLVRPRGTTQAFVATNRRCRQYLDDKLNVSCAPCLATVYVDGVVVSRTGVPFDVATLAADDVEAIEYYAGPAETPLRYTDSFNPCGALVIHTRR